MNRVSQEGIISIKDPATSPADVDHSHDLSLIQKVAEHAARSAGRLQMRHFGETTLVLDDSKHDLKIATDRTSETVICLAILEQFPHHAILSEESGSLGVSEYTWVIDPLDGSVNYYFGLPYFCTCVSCYHTPASAHPSLLKTDQHIIMEGKPLVGVVYAPYFDWMYSAVSGQGATLNHRSLRSRPVDKLEDSVIGISYGSREGVIRRMEAVAEKLLRQAKKIRMLGATGLDLTQVAKGSLTGLVQLNVNVWDFAAARLILTESGASFEARPNSRNGWQILAAPQPIFDQLKGIIDATLVDGFILPDEKTGSGPSDIKTSSIQLRARAKITSHF